MINKTLSCMMYIKGTCMPTDPCTNDPPHPYTYIPTKKFEFPLDLQFNSVCDQNNFMKSRLGFSVEKTGFRSSIPLTSKHNTLSPTLMGLNHTVCNHCQQHLLTVLRQVGNSPTYLHHCFSDLTHPHPIPLRNLQFNMYYHNRLC